MAMIGVGEVFTMDRHHDPDERKAHAEGGQNGINLQLSLIFRTPHKRTQKRLVNHPIAEK
jgi:hypothetical protein